MSQQTFELPQVNDAEQAVLGTLLSTGFDPDVALLLTAADFYKAAHGTIYEAIVELADENAPVTGTSVATHLTTTGKLSQVGGTGYLRQLIDLAQPGSTRYYAEQVRSAAGRRSLIQYHLSGIQAAQDGSGYADLSSVIEAAQSGLDGVVTERGSNDVVSIADTIMPTIDFVEAVGARSGSGPTGVPTGFADLDELTAGLHAGQLVVIAGRPGSGKTTIGLDIIRSASIHHGLRSLMFTLEMSRVELTMRLISAHCRIALSKLRTGDLSDDEWTRFGSKMRELADAPIFIDDTAETTITSIRTKARRMKSRNEGLSLIVVDYLQLISSDGRANSRQEEVASWSRRLKLLAKELEVPIVLLAQLNRGPESRQDKRPLVSDLRESGAVEQDADAVILVHREDMYDPATPRVGEADLILGKQRSGPTGTVKVLFQGLYCRMVAMPS